MDQVAKKKIDRSVRFTLNGKIAILSEARDLFNNHVVTLIVGGEYIGAFEDFTLDEVHTRLLKDIYFMEKAYC